MGETESLKTWAVLHVIAQEIRNGNAAIYVDIEDEAVTTVERLLQMGLTPDEIADGLLYVNPRDGFDDVSREHLRHDIDWLDSRTGRKVRLTVIDSMTEAMSLETLNPNIGANVATF